MADISAYKSFQKIYYSAKDNTVEGMRGVY